jgi:hypothetical protein
MLYFYLDKQCLIDQPKQYRVLKKFMDTAHSTAVER